MSLPPIFEKCGAITMFLGKNLEKDKFFNYESRKSAINQEV